MRFSKTQKRKKDREVCRRMKFHPVRKNMAVCTFKSYPCLVLSFVCACIVLLEARSTFLADQLTRLDFPEALDLRPMCRLHRGRAGFPFCVFNNSTTATQPACFLPVATIAVLTVLQSPDSLHIITSNTRHSLSRVHQSPLITLPLTLSLLRRFLCILAYFPINVALCSSALDSTLLCCIL